MLSLDTITTAHRDLQRISIYIPFIVGFAAIQDRSPTHVQVDSPTVEWLSLDRVLVGLWESHAIRAKIVYPRLPRVNWGGEMRIWAEFLLPEMTRSGVIDLAGRMIRLVSLAIVFCRHCYPQRHPIPDGYDFER